MSLVTLKFLLVFAGATAIHFDNKLTVIKNDCYERLAIGEKLSPEQTYKKFEHNTVSACEAECTKEQKLCRAYSFGIGKKGNGTCLLGKNIIKETSDLKPIGTIKDTDYDLYTKTLDCQIVLEPPQHPEEHSVPPPVTIKVSKPVQNAVQEQHGDHHVPAQSNHYQNSIAQPSPGYQYGKPQVQPSNGYGSTGGGDGVHHVQTLVSIASGPETVLHPVHDILVSQDNYNGQAHQQDNGNLPPFRPAALPHPYNEHNPSANINLQYGYGYGSHYDENRPDPETPSRPSYDSNLSSGYGQVQVDRRKYQSQHSSYNSFESENHRYTLGHAQDYNPNYNFYDQYEKPFPNYPNKYGSVIPHPNDYSRPDYDYLFLRPGNDRPNFDDSGSINPYNQNSTPNKGTGYTYNVPARPFDDKRPTSIGSNKPNYYDTNIDSNLGPTGSGYGSKPSRPSEDLSYGYPRPDHVSVLSYGYNSRPGYNYNRPSGYGNPKPPSPVLEENPNNLSSSSRPPSTELTNHYGGVDYRNKYYGKPAEPYDKNYGGDRKVDSGSKVTGTITEIRDGKSELLNFLPFGSPCIILNK